MIDRAAVATARTAAQAVEHDAHALRDQLLAAKADLRRLQAELTLLPGRVADLQGQASTAKAQADAAVQTRAQLGTQQASAQAQAQAADASVASLQAQIGQAQQELAQLVREAHQGGGGGRPGGGGGRPPIQPKLPVNGGGGDGNGELEQLIVEKEGEIASLRQSLTAEQAASTAAHQQLAALAAQIASADAAVQSTQAAAAALASQLAEAQAALNADTSALPAAQALPVDLRGQIAAARDRVTAAWSQWSTLLAAGHAAVAAAVAARDTAAAGAAAADTAVADAQRQLADAERSGNAAGITSAQAAATAAASALDGARKSLAQAAAALDTARASLVEGDDPDDLLQLVAADVPLLLLPVRLETCFEPHDGGGGDLLVRVYPDSVHVYSHEPELTADELAWGKQYLEHEQAAAADADRARAAWAQLAGRFGPERAAWIAQAAKGGNPPLRSASWTRPPTSFVLPDRWLALGYRAGARRFAVLGAPITDSLAVGPDPGEAAPDPAAPLGEAARWLLDFDSALAAGMALRIALDADDTHGLDRLVVLGVRSSIAADESARRVSTLLDGHHYTDGLALVPTGTPTNNTASARAGWSSSDEGYARTWQTERGAPLNQAGDGSDADLVTRALGVAGAPLAHAGHGDSAGEGDARHMAAALWPAGWGYALRQLVGAGLPESVLAEARAHMLEHVRARGPLAGLRLGRQPYGLLPATSLQRFALLDPADVDAQLPAVLRALEPAWAAAAAGVPRVTPDAAVDEVLTGALEMSPIAVRYAARALGLHPDTNAADAFARRQQALALPRALDLPFEPPLARAGFELATTDLTGPAVTDAPSETDPLPDDGNYVRWLAGSGWEAVRNGQPPAGGDTLLFALLRHALLRQYADTALAILRAHGLAEPGEGSEPGLGGGGPSPWVRLAAPIDGVTGGQPLGAFLDGLRASASPPAAAETAELVELQAALVHLAGLPSASLERLLAETLDLSSHRLDAWVTAQATRRLEALRAGRPDGVRLGGYGVLYDVKPAPVRTLAEQVAELQTALTAANKDVTAAAAARAQLSPGLAAAQSQEASAAAAVSAVNAQIDQAQAELDALLEAADQAGDGAAIPRLRPTNGGGGGGGGGPSPVLLKRIHDKEQQIAGLQGSLASAQHTEDAAVQNLAGVMAQVAAADAAAAAAQANVARITAQLAAAQAAEQDAIDLATNKGFIHAPSLGQAATAAVLRSGHLAHRQDTDSPFAVDLSSRRVRLGLGLLDGIRQGQPLGALLGYRFERGLHEGHPGLQLDRDIAILRALAPLDDSSQAEADLRDALARQADLGTRLGALQQQLSAEEAADGARKAALQSQLTAAQAQLAAAQSNARSLADALDQAQTDLQNLLDQAGDAEVESHIPPWKLPNGDYPGAGIPQWLQLRIHAASQKVLGLQSQLDAANAAAAAAQANVGNLSAQLGAADPLIDTLQQAITDLQPELDAANAAVAAARAKLEELRGQLREQAAEAVRANNVVDGLALRRRWRTGTKDGRWDTSTIPFGDPEIGLPALGTPEQQAIDSELRALDGAVDALGDLLTAESVHQLVQGNSLRAGATVDALSRGEAPPPDPELARTPRAGIGVTHRLVVLLDPAGPAAVGWPTDKTQLRAHLEPALEAWAARLLGGAARAHARARYSWPGNEKTAEADLRVLQLSALDVCAAAAVAAPAGATELELRWLDYFRRNRPAGVPAQAAVALELERDPAWAKNVLDLAELLESARAVRDLIVGARPLDARDLAVPGETVEPGVDDAELTRRAQAAVKAFADAGNALKAAGGDLHAALLQAAALGIPGAVPVDEDAASLAAQAAAVAKELARRTTAAAAANGAAARLTALLGPDWRPLGHVTAAAPGELQAAFAASGTVQGGDPMAAVVWLQRAAHVREGAARLDEALLYAEASATPEQLSLHVAQLPFRPGDRWVGLPATAEQPIQGGRLSLVAHASAVPPPGKPVVGLVVDEWTEVVPAATQVTGLSFHFDQPNSRAPQAILLAVPPTEDRVWNLDTLEAVVLETLDLADVRLADPAALGRAGSTATVPGAGHYLPALYLASSPADGTVTTDLGRVAAPSPTA
jgi:hypothetical protein